MKTKLFYSLILVSSMTFAGVSVNYASAQTTKKNVEKTVTTKTVTTVKHSVKYTCPMHPEVVMNNKAAKCPKCGMALVEKKEKVMKKMNQMKVTKDSTKTIHSKMMKETPMK